LYEEFAGYTGDDTIDGGSGFDLVDYRWDTSFDGNAGVSVDLESGTATDGFGDTDTLIGIEGVRGTDMADTIVGGAGGDSIAGRDGADTLKGGLGSDRVDGGAGDDRLDGEDGANTLLGGGGNDVLYGDAEAVPAQQSFADTGLFPDVAEFVDIGNLPSPGDGALGIAAGDTSVGDDATAELTFAGGTAGYANTIGLYTIGPDGTTGDVSFAFEDASALDPGDAATVALPGGAGSGFGLFRSSTAPVSTAATRGWTWRPARSASSTTSAAPANARPRSPMPAPASRWCSTTGKPGRYCRDRSSIPLNGAARRSSMPTTPCTLPPDG